MNREVQPSLRDSFCRYLCYRSSVSTISAPAKCLAMASAREPRSDGSIDIVSNTKHNPIHRRGSLDRRPDGSERTLFDLEGANYYRAPRARYLRLFVRSWKSSSAPIDGLRYFVVYPGLTQLGPIGARVRASGPGL